MSSGENDQVSPSKSSPVSFIFGSKIFLAIGVTTLIVVSTGIAYYFGTKKSKKSVVNSTSQSPEPIKSIVSPTTSEAASLLFSGQLKRLNQDLKIFKFTQIDVLNSVENSFIYYEAGKFMKGELKDYTRVIAIRPSEGPGPPLIFLLATHDYKSYVLDDPESKTTKYPEDDWQNPYNILDKTKIISVKTFDTEQPKEIVLDHIFSLFTEEYSTESKESGQTDKNGNKIYEIVLTTDFSSYQKLTSSLDNVTLYFKPYKQDMTYFNQLNQAEKEKMQLRLKYFLGETEVVVVDSVGLPITYALTTSESIKSYTKEAAQYAIDWKKYQDQLKLLQNKQISEYPKSPSYVYPPNMGFLSSEIANQKNEQFYTDYRTAIPGACAFTQNSNVMNVQDSDLEQIGSVLNLSLYRLKDKNHSLYSLSYDNKMDYYLQDPTSWDQVNKGIKKPTLEEYIALNPLLFIKDYWQRWIALGEFDINLPGGCGKPVVYLYPKKQTRVIVQFQLPVQFTTNIPTYGNFWEVLADPDGLLTNLRPGLTDCDQIDPLKFGSEYAKDACKKNVYPYLYWAGNVHSKNYPSINKGWIVDRNDLESFFEKKLTEIGLNNSEKNDFMSYWLTNMLSKNSSYYRVKFLQTNDLNMLFPMTVNPNPDTIFRLFLDYTPLANKPNILPQPQSLNKLIRNGFTLVEWGGLKQP